MRLSDFARLSLGQLLPGQAADQGGFAPSDHSQPPAAQADSSVMADVLATFGANGRNTHQPTPDSPLAEAALAARHHPGHARALGLRHKAGAALGQASASARLIEDWAALGGRLAVTLRDASRLRDFVPRIVACEHILQELLHRNTEASLYLMFQLSQLPHAGYSTSHALLCATLCQLMAPDLELNLAQTQSLTRAALTMNVAMTELQDELSRQSGPLTPAQRDTVLTHAVRGRLMLADTGVCDTLWLDIVAGHHEPLAARQQPGVAHITQQLTHVLQVVDRYCAGLAARAGRPAQSPEECAAHTLQQPHAGSRAESVLLRTIGLHPPGTYVCLHNGELAVVTQRSSEHQPLMAISILDGRGRPLAIPALRNTETPGCGVVESLAAAEVNVLLEHEDMLQLSQQPPGAAPDTGAGDAPHAALHPRDLQLH